MAGTHSYTCPKCGVSKGGYRFQFTAREASEHHLWKKHGVDVTRNKRYSR
jgi:hypothetical protein